MIWRSNTLGNGCIMVLQLPKPVYFGRQLKTGWQRVIPLESSCDSENQCRWRAKFGRGVASRVVGTSYKMLFGGVPRRKCRSREYDCRIETSDKAIEELEGLEKLCQEGKIELERSRTYLEWRIDCHPEQKYRYIMCFESEDLVGYAGRIVYVA